MADKKKNIIQINENKLRNMVQGTVIKVLKENPGKQDYKLHLFDPLGKRSCNLTPVKGKINAQEVLPLLEKMPFVEFDLR